MISMRKELRLGADGKIEQLSQNEKGFLEILDADTKKYGNHHEVPLPFKQKVLNNFRALKRMHLLLKRRFRKESSFFEDY